MEPGVEIDGYKLLRIIGQGAFGQVWLVHSSFTNEYKALKLIAGTSQAEVAREFEGLIALKEQAPWLNQSGIMPIEHANRLDSGFFYIMPLSDGIAPNIPPDNDEWTPYTLAYLLQAHLAAGSWLSSQDIIFCISHLLHGAIALERVGLVHRDIKPENVLFLHEYPVLSDCSLVGRDKIELTRRGTPGYAAPRYYTENGGNPDMYSLGALLYTLLSGKNPDSSNLAARRAYWWPPQGQESLSLSEQTAWNRLRNITLKCLDDEDKYPTLDHFLRALTQQTEQPDTYPSRFSYKTASRFLLGILGVVIIGAIVAWGFLKKKPAISPSHVSAPKVASSIEESNDWYQQLNALEKEAREKLEEYKKLVYQEANQPIDGILTDLEKIEATSPSAQQMLAEFIKQQSDFKLLKVNKKNKDILSNEVTSYTGKIYKFGKTDAEKQITIVRAADFNKESIGFIFNRVKSKDAEQVLKSKIDKLIATRRDASTTRINDLRNRLASTPNQDVQIQQSIQDEEKASRQFACDLSTWFKGAGGEILVFPVF